MVQRKIIWSINALNDKLSIFEFWYNKNKSSDYPLKLDYEFDKIIKLIKIFEDLGKLIPGTDQRFLIKDHFEIIYTVNNEAVEILHIWDTRQNPENLPL